MKQIPLILIVLAGMLSSCATELVSGVNVFPYKFYYLDVPSSSLLGPAAVNDLPISTCQDPKVAGHNCVVMLKSDFQLLYQDYMEK